MIPTIGSGEVERRRNVNYFGTLGVRQVEKLMKQSREVQSHDSIWTIDHKREHENGLGSSRIERPEVVGRNHGVSRSCEVWTLVGLANLRRRMVRV
jgi:hypothetical protein